MESDQRKRQLILVPVTISLQSSACTVVVLPTCYVELGWCSSSAKLLWGGQRRLVIHRHVHVIESCKLNYAAIGRCRASEHQLRRNRQLQQALEPRAKRSGLNSQRAGEAPSLRRGSGERRGAGAALERQRAEAEWWCLDMYIQVVMYSVQPEFGLLAADCHGWC